MAPLIRLKPCCCRTVLAMTVVSATVALMLAMRAARAQDPARVPDPAEEGAVVAVVAVVGVVDSVQLTGEIA